MRYYAAVRLSAVLLVTLLSVPTAALAEDIEAAKRYVAAGVAARKQGDYDGAVDLFQKAQQAAPNPLVIYNIAQTHREAMAKVTDPEKRAKHRDAARAAYREFIASKPDEEVLATAQGYLFQLEEQYRQEHPAEEAARRDKLAAEEEAKIKAAQAKLAADRKARETRDAQEAEHVASVVREQELGKARTVKIVGLSVMGGGVIATGIGVYFGLRAKSLSDALTAEDVYDTDRIDQGKQADRNMAIAYITGGTLLVGGAVTYLFGYVLGSRATESSAPTVTVAPTSGGAAFVVGGQF